MSSVSTALGPAGAGHRLEYRGRVYEATNVFQRLKSVVERHFQAKARKNVCEWSGMIPPDEFRAMLKDLNDRIDAGEYSWAKLTPLLSTPEGMFALVQACFGVDEDTAFGMLHDKGPEVEAVLDLIKRESFPNG